MHKRPSFLVGLLIASSLVVAFSAGCGDITADPIGDENVTDGNVTGPGDFGGQDASTSGDGGSVPSGADFCTSAGIPLPGQSSCAGDLPRHFFRFAACSCTNLAISGSIRTSSINSTDGTSNEEAASIAANKNLALSGTGTIGGSTYGAGDGAPVVYSIKTTVRHDTWSGGNIVVNGTHTVEGNAYVVGSISGQSFSVKGKVEKVTDVEDPCDCNDKLDIPAIIEPYKTTNDNGTIGLKDDALAHGGELTLPCGRYHLTEITGEATLNIKGRVAIFVDANVSISGKMKVNVDPGAELDLFVAGNVALSGKAEFGSLAAPAKVRVYTAKNFALSGLAQIGGNIYAPNANIALSSLFKMSGSMFANQMAFSGGFDVTYDEAILDSTGCSAPSGSCSSTSDCPSATPSCKGGACTKCETNADCPAPLKCSDGACVADIRVR